MARYRGPVCRLCRREGEKLFLKGERCYTSKCAVEKREGTPGQHSRGRQNRSDFNIQLRAKQKAKRIYGLTEHIFKRLFKRAAKTKGITGTEFLRLLERRLDNVVYRMGLGVSRQQSRQLVGHGHVLVNGKSVNIPSYQVAVGDVIEVTDKLKQNVNVIMALDSMASGMVPEWIKVEKDNRKGEVIALPTREMMPQNINDQLIVELYSK